MSAVELTKEQLKELGAKCWRSAPEFCRVFLPAWFPSKMPWFHRGLAALRTGQTAFLLDFGKEWWPEDIARGVPSEWTMRDLIKIVTNFVIEVKPAKMHEGRVVEPAVLAPIFVLEHDDEDHVTGVAIADPQDNNAFILPRGFSKTTLINALNLRDIVYQEETFILYVSETEGHASNQVMTLRGQLEGNELLRAVWGNLVPDRTHSNKWGESLIEPLNGVRVQALGSGQQVRGIIKDAVRPSRIVVDDFQESEGVKSEPQRRKDNRWFVQVLLPSRKLFGTGVTKVDVIGTLLHPEAVMAVLMTDPDWTRVRFGAIDRQGEPLWAYAMDEAKLAKVRAQFERLGELDAFDYEYMSNVPMDDGVKFPVDKIIRINRPDDWFAGKAIVCDPAISENPKADFFALAAVGIGKFGKIHVINFFAKVGVEFDEQAELFFEFHFAHCLSLPPAQCKHGVEAVAYQRALASLITSKQHEKSKTWGQRAFFEVIPLLHGKKGKVMRVQGLLSPRVKAGHVSFEHTFPVLEGQLHDWGLPTAKKDGPDVIAMGIGLLDPFAPLIGNEEPEEGHEETADVVQPKPFRRVLKAP